MHFTMLCDDIFIDYVLDKFTITYAKIENKV